MRRLAERIRFRVPLTYKHFLGRQALEEAVISPARNPGPTRFAPGWSRLRPLCST
jgi:hypothetical protein